jgi:threonylcarbamoyladenosine tRNA methylthiotransferase MtaB
MPAKVAFTTLGCRLNQAESDSIGDDLALRGFEPVGDCEPDLVVVNTCTVTREATKASRSAIRRAVRSHPHAKVVVIGCYAVSDRSEVEAIDGVDAVLTNDDKERFVDALARSSRATLLQIGRPRGARPQSSPPPEVRVRANLKVQTGCDEWCSFCIIPTTRGPLRTLDEGSIVTAARAKVASGAREIVLTGVHLGKYGYDKGGDEGDLIRLLQRLLEIDGLRRLRLSSILSQHLTEEVVAFMASEPRMCRYLHVPLQSGDDGVLARMNRPYRVADYAEAIGRAKASLTGLGLATDIIVGFPGESDSAFESTVDLVSDIGFSKLHVFRYSARAGTAAATMSDDIAPEVRRERSKRLIDLGNDIRMRWLHEHLGKRLEVLVEDERAIDGNGVCSGQTDDHVRVWFEGSGLLGTMVSVEGTRVRADGIEGHAAVALDGPAWHEASGTRDGGV